MRGKSRRDHSYEEFIEELLETGKDAFGLRLRNIEASGVSMNTAGIRSEHLLLSRRIDSRTYFVQDKRYGVTRELGVFEGRDRTLMSRARSILKELDISRDEIRRVSVMTEYSQNFMVVDKRIKKKERVQEGQRLVRVDRQVEGLPVWTSSLLLGLTRNKQTGFLQMHWPEIPPWVTAEALRLRNWIGREWNPPERDGVRVESFEAGIVHSPAISFVMDIQPAVRVIYSPSDSRFGKKPTLYLDRHGREIIAPRQFSAPPDHVRPSQTGRTITPPR